MAGGRVIQDLAFKRILAGAFLALAIADVVTTNRALAHTGVIEANPLVAWLQSSFGAVWFLPKLAVSIAFAMVASAKWFAPAIAIYMLAVVDNLFN